eukprot:1957811-Rhodomonas_salina.1
MSWNHETGMSVLGWRPRQTHRGRTCGLSLTLLPASRNRSQFWQQHTQQVSPGHRIPRSRERAGRVSAGHRRPRAETESGACLQRNDVARNADQAPLVLNDAVCGTHAWQADSRRELRDRAARPLAQSGTDPRGSRLTTG